MINIGPWWLFDILAFSIIISCTMFGMRKGFFVTFYILVLQVIVIIILLFVPALLTNSLNPLLMQLWVKLRLVDVFSYFGDTIGKLVSGLLPNNGSESGLPVGAGGTGYEILKTLSGLILYLFMCVFVFTIVNLIGLILYRAFKKRINKMKVVRKVDTLLGTFNGLAIGMALSMSFSLFLSFPLFQTENQKIGLTNFSNMTEEQIKDTIFGGNSYKKYSLSRKIAAPLPSVPVFAFTYTNGCINKYVINPFSIMAMQLISKQSLPDLKNFFLVYEDVMAEGYATNNPLQFPISACIETMPQDTRALFRFTSEMMLMGSTMFVNGVNSQKATVTSVELINAFDQYYLESGKDDKKIHDGWLDMKEFEKFYEWAQVKTEQDGIEANPFITLANKLDASSGASGTSTNQRYLSKILRNAKQNYNFFKNINYVNATTRSNLDSIPFLSTIYTATYLIEGFEITPSGELKLGEFYDSESPKKDVEPSNNDIAKINHDKEFWRNVNDKGYSGTYWIEHYFNFAKGYWN
ncbi:hypothetical protein [Spiroplasma cantharicola]|uniref:Uncharacterized protein n=1 Tax=Spiroplasma cantharicola TaxID=362837 RepID=A0A0M4K1W6_9MOLU|nr:hypothetical protein [Spiroplasma cantharicola]ALD66662.1 hypothetical protein SCANT_v1c07560 [Spiroplasma cantharicola]